MGSLLPDRPCLGDALDIQIASADVRSSSYGEPNVQRFYCAILQPQSPTCTGMVLIGKYRKDWATSLVKQCLTWPLR